MRSATIVLCCSLLSGCGARPATPEPHGPSAATEAAAPSPLAAQPPDALDTASAPVATPSATPQKLNVLVISVDAMRADMPWAGYPRPIAPNLTQLEKASVSYTRAYALSSYTAMSMGGFLAGRYPGELKRSGFFFSSYPEDELFFPELLQQAGIVTIAGQAHFYFDKKAGFRQGFDDYRMVEGIVADNTTDKNITSPQHLKLAIEQLSKPANTGGQFFAWYHFMDPHDAYNNHDGYQTWGKSPRDRYDAEMLYTDHHIGKLLQFVTSQPWGERTAIIVTADHGEGFRGDKRRRHGFELWEPLVHVPLFIKVPGVKPRRISTPRSHIDLAPTIFELLGVKAHDDFRGKSLVDELKGGDAEEREVIIDLPRTSDNFRRRAMVVGNYKLISFGDDFRYQLFDVVADPNEKTDLRASKRKIYNELKKRYLERVKSIKDICPKMRHRLKGKRPEREC